MSESNDYKVLKKNLPQGFDRIDRVENCVVAGMPDINYCTNCVECWIELKSPKEPKRATTKLFGSNHLLSQDQKNWIKRQSSAGGSAWVLIATDKRWILMHGKWADTINIMTVEELLERCSWTCDKPVRDKEKWMQLRHTIQTSA